MAFCKNCGKELSDGAMFCPNCGTSINGQTNADEEPKSVFDTIKEGFKEGWHEDETKSVNQSVNLNNDNETEELSRGKKIVLAWAFITACLFFLLGFTVEEEGYVCIVISLIVIGLIVCIYKGIINRKYTWYISLGSLLFMTILFGSVNQKGNDEKQPSVGQKQETVTEKKQERNEKADTQKKEEQKPQKSKKDEIRELGFNNGVNFAYQDKGETLKYFIQSGLSMNNAEERIKQAGRLSYKEDYGSDISDDLLNEYGEKFCEGYKSIVIKK